MPGLSDFPTTIDSYTADEDGVTTIHADDVNEARDFAIAAQTKAGADDDALSAATLEGRAKYQEAGGLKRGSSVASATSITLADTAQVFPITGTAAIATIVAPSYPRLVLLEFASALTLTHGSGNLTLPGASDLAVPAGAVVALEWTGSTWRVAGAAGSTPPIDPAANVGGSRTLGTGALQATAGNDTRLSDARTPTAHATSHVTVGQDPLPTFTATTRGLVPPPGGSPSGVKALYDNGTWADPAVASGGMSNPLTAADSLIVGGAAGDPTELPAGTDGQVVGIDPSDHHTKFINVPSKHVIYDETSPVTDRPVLAFQGAGVTVTDDSGDGATLVTIPGGGLSNPMTTQDDLIVGGSSGTPGRLAKGADGQVLTVDPSTHHLVWATPSGGGGGGGASGAIFDPPPLYASWTALNTGALVVTDAVSGLVLDWPATASPGNHLRGVEETVSGTWTRVARIDDLRPLSNSTMVGLMMRQVGAGTHQNQALAFTFVGETGVATNRLQLDSWTDVNTHNTTIYNTLIEIRAPVWMRIRNDGTLIHCELSVDDGQTYMDMVNFGTTANFDAVDRVGVVVSPFGSGVAIHATLRSWGTASPTYSAGS